MVLALAPAATARADTVLTPPVITSASPEDGGAYVEWDAGDQNGITGYVVTASPGGQTCVPGPFAAYGCLVTGLTNGVAYTLTVVASGNGQSSAPSAPSATVVPRSDFSAPQLESSEVSPHVLPASGGTVTVTAHITDEGSGLAEGEPQASLEHTWVPGHLIERTAPVALTRTSGDADDGMYEGSLVLPPDSDLGTWFVSLGVLTDADGNGGQNETSADPSPFVKVGYPAQVTGVTAELRPGRMIHVSWQPVTDDGGVPLTGYAVSSDGILAGQTVDASTTSTDIPVPDTLSGGTYSFFVQAVNATGRSAFSDTTTPLSVPNEAPSPPGAQTWVEDSTVQVFFSAPQRTYGAPVTGYTVTGEPGDLQCTAVHAGECTFPAVNGTDYSFSVTATNSAGTSTATVPSGDAVPYGTPIAPASVHVVRSGITGMIASWSAATTNGRPIEGYVVTFAPASGDAFSETVSSTTRSITRYFFHPSTAYTVTVAAFSMGLLSSATAAPEHPALPDATVRPRAVPQPSVTGVTRTTATVRWTGTADPGGTPVQHYLVRVWHGTQLLGTTTVPSSARSLTERGLVAGRSHSVRVYAVNAAGSSSQSPSCSFTTRR